MTKVYLIRHAEAEGNLYRRVHGWYNSLITPRGYLQIQALEQRFSGEVFHAVYSSDLFRTMTTASAIYKSHDLPLQTHAGLREVNLGTWEDRTWGEIARNDIDTLGKFNTTHPDWQVEDGENYHQLRARVSNTILELAKEHPGETIAMFCHGLAIRNALAVFLGLSVEESAQMGHSDNTAVSCLEIDGDAVKVVFQDDASHLSEDISTFARQKWWKQDTGGKVDSNLWFHPLDVERQLECYTKSRQETWQHICGVDCKGQDEAWVSGLEKYPNSLMCAMLGDELVGFIHMDVENSNSDESGQISFLYLLPKFRGEDLAVQLLGQAVATFRPLGCTSVCVYCSEINEIAYSFFLNNGFKKTGDSQNGGSSLDRLEKYIGYDEK